LGHLHDAAVNESSGLIASRRNPGLYWTHNDSGDGPFLYCLRGRGESCGVWTVTGAEARDWEDMAAGPGPGRQRSYLYVGDIGDNLDDQEHVTVYRVAEPDVAASPTGTRSAPAATEEAEALGLRFPDGPHNAEALLVHPQTGDLYLVTKEGAAAVYVARAPLSPSSVNLLVRVAVLPIGTGQGRNGLVTGGDISPDGRRVALCTYGDAYELEAPAGEEFDAVWQQPPHRIRLGVRPVGEAIAYRLDGRALLTTSEEPLGAPTPFEQVERR
jgi:hypothetical protein